MVSDKFDNKHHCSDNAFLLQCDQTKFRNWDSPLDNDIDVTKVNRSRQKKWDLWLYDRFTANIVHDRRPDLSDLRQINSLIFNCGTELHLQVHSVYFITKSRPSTKVDCVFLSSVYGNPSHNSRVNFIAIKIYINKSPLIITYCICS